MKKIDFETWRRLLKEEIETEAEREGEVQHFVKSSYVIRFEGDPYDEMEIWYNCWGNLIIRNTYLVDEAWITNSLESWFKETGVTEKDKLDMYAVYKPVWL